MIPILYEHNERSFDHNGIGALTDAISCRVRWEKNGQYELTMVYPTSGDRFSGIGDSSIILAKPAPNRQPQPFRVYRMVPGSGGRMTVYARHVAYDLQGIPAAPFFAGNLDGAMREMRNAAVVECPFSFSADFTAGVSMIPGVPKPIWELMGAGDGCILSTYGGEWEFDRFDIRLHQRMGADTGYAIRYGKNLKTLEMDRNIANCYTGIYPYWTDSEGNLVELPGRIIMADGEFDHTRILPVDLSSEFDAEPTAQELTLAAQEYILANGIGVPTVSWRIQFVDLAQTEEYRNQPGLGTVSWGDSVNVVFPALRVNATARVVATEFDVLADRFLDITLGSVAASIADTIVANKRAQQLDAVRKQREYLARMRQLAEEAAAKAEEAEKNAKDYADDAAQNAGDAAVEEAKKYTDVEVTKTATSLGTRIENSEGEISTLKQTATSISTRIENAEGEVSTLKQTASSLTSRVQDAEGNVSKLSQKVDSISIQVSNGSDKSTIKVFVDGVEISSQDITLDGVVTFEALQGKGTTVIDGSNITTGAIQSKDGTTFYLDLDKGVLRLRANELRIGDKTTEEIAAAQAVAKLNEYAALVSADIEDLQEQIDGHTIVWYGTDKPTARNYPASNWTTTDDKEAHLGDLYYDTDHGYTYRWMFAQNTYFWEWFQDADIATALANAATAKDMADGKRRVFTAQPTPPYDKGDLWSGGSGGDLMVCQTSRSSGSYRSSDWVLATKYIDQTKADDAASAAASAALSDAKNYADDAASAAGSAALADAKTYAATIAQAKVDAQTQQKIFNILTNNGQTQGIYLQDGKIYINMEYLVSKYLEATLIALRGQFEVYSGSTLGGYLGSIQGITDTGTTNGIGIRNKAGDIFVAATDGGAIMRAGNAMVYIAKGTGKVRVVGNLEVSGSVTQNTG